MRLTTITNWAYGATVALTLISGATMILASEAHEDERAAVEQRYRLDQATSSLAGDVFRLTGQARQYVLDGNPSHLIVYKREAESLESVEKRIEHIAKAGAAPSELRALSEAIRWADLLHDEQDAAIAAWQNGDSTTARQIMFGAEYERELNLIKNQIERFQYQLDLRTASEVEDATELSAIWRTVADVALAITALLLLCVLSCLLRQRILKPVVRLSDVLTRLAARDYAVDLPEYTQIDEIGDMAKAVEVFRESGLRSLELEQQREREILVRDMMARMTQRLQSCESMEQIGEVVAQFMPEIGVTSAGCLHLYEPARNAMVELSTWRSPVEAKSEFAPADCWALQRGKPHRFNHKSGEMPCKHVDDDALDGAKTVCLPLTAQQEVVGLLYIEHSEEEDSKDAFVPETYIAIMAENIGLAIANLRLREELRELAMVDPLTGLCNRRELTAQIARYQPSGDRADETVSCMLLDIDRFKHFNDDFGHDAGDLVLREVGALLRNSVREDMMAFRYGGEEFVLLLPDVDVDKAKARAQQIWAAVAELDLYEHGKKLDDITVSIGLATTPTHASATDLVRTADAALLRAKRTGRNRIVVAETRSPRSSAA